jgi:hypothetical protein
MLGDQNAENIWTKEELRKIYSEELHLLVLFN